MRGEQEGSPCLVPLLLASSTVARAPVTVFSVLFVLQSKDQFHSLAPGGTAVMLYSVGAAIAGVTSALLLRRFGQFRTAVGTGAAATVALILQSVPGGSPARFEGLALLVGIVMPPLHIASRALYPRLLSQDRLLRVYSWDVTTSQVAWIAVPALVVAAEPTLGVASVYRLLAALTAAGVAVYSRTVRGIPAAQLPPREERMPTAEVCRLLGDPKLFVYIGAGAAMMFVSGVVMPVLVAVSPSGGAKSVAILVWSVGSFLGSLIVNRRGVRRAVLMRNIAVAFCLSAGTLFWLHMPAIDFTLLVLGFSTSPVTGLLFYFIARRYPARSQIYVFGLATSVQLVAGGIGSFLCGLLLDHRMYVAVAVAYFVPIVLQFVLVGRAAFTASAEENVEIVPAAPNAPSPYAP